MYPATQTGITVTDPLAPGYVGTYSPPALYFVQAAVEIGKGYPLPLRHPEQGLDPANDGHL